MHQIKSARELIEFINIDDDDVEYIVNKYAPHV